MDQIGTTTAGYTVMAIPPGVASPMSGHRGGEIAVDEQSRTMYAWGELVTLYGADSIMWACDQYHWTGPAARMRSLVPRSEVAA